MKRTQANQVYPPAFQVHKLAYHILYSGGILYLLYGFLWNQGFVFALGKVT
jgi:hypothetical protein